MFCRCSFDWLGFPPCWRAYFLLLRQKKVAKEKATPGAAPCGFLPLLGRPGGLLNSPSAQTTQAEGPRHSCVAQRLPRGPQKRPRSTVTREKADFHGQPGKKPKNEIHRLSVDALPGPLRGAEQRRKAGGLRRGLFEGQSPEFRSRPAFRVAQGTGAAGTDPGSPFLCLLSFGEAKESKTPHKGGTPCQLHRNANSRKSLEIRPAARSSPADYHPARYPPPSVRHEYGPTQQNSSPSWPPPGQQSSAQ